MDLTNQIIQGDCVEVMKSMPDNCVDLCFTSPPYFNARQQYASYSTYQEYLDFLSQVTKQVFRVLKDNRIFVINLSCVIVPREKRSTESTRLAIPFDYLPIATQTGFKFVDDIIWVKPDGASNRAIKFAPHRRPVAYKPFQVTEYLLVFKRGYGLLDLAIRDHSPEIIQASLVADGYERTNVWQIRPENPCKVGHPAPFPLELAQKVVEYYSYVGDLVLDPFLGAGTTALAARQLGRNYLGIERCPDYCEIAQNRIKSTK